MKNEEIINKVKKLGNVKSVVYENFRTGKYEVHVMKSYQGGEGLGYMGSMSILEIHFKTQLGAEKLSKMINLLQKRKR